MSAPPLTVLIATAGRAELLPKTLASIAEGALPEAYRETVVVENGPASGAEAVVASADPRLHARYVYSEVPSKSRALNGTLEALDDGLVVFFDDDVEVEPQTLTAYAEAAAAAGPRHYFGGNIRPKYEERPPDWLIPFFPPSARGLDLSAAPQAFFIGLNWGAYRDDLVRVGLFDPTFGPGPLAKSSGEEIDMQRRLQADGVGKVNVPRAAVWHHVPPSRCSPHWAVGRFYQQGLERGIRIARTGGYREAGVSLAALGVNALRLANPTTHRDPVRLIRARASVYGRWGVLRGLASELWDRARS